MSRFSSSGVKRNNERISNCTAAAVSKDDNDDNGDLMIIMLMTVTENKVDYDHSLAF